MNATQLFLGVIFGSIGLGYFIYGKKQKRSMPFMCGLSLMVYPYFFDSNLAIVSIGCILTAIPYFVRV
ncbi:hypothetical protein P255_01772 [Acinetobacter brisouii CIP 110357]|uniref:Amino acid transport protein n=1 Tax=Acinetobacter brisouii CIP 110357 TaxID=1341683 RepID=V2UMS3_9GAMM|nr:hypothetical protein [Acinetobacter brisouii]ENV47764.1 hypothetical protein F954_00823 [Acinetobacter brisouii ANC 4119]ESK51262.1 hypothetical protein P255_01772 [Acinetobacter brisouii CIP 110357]